MTMTRTLSTVRELAPGEWYRIERWCHDGAADEYGPATEPCDWFEDIGPFDSAEAAWNISYPPDYWN
jgi:hypothetical protein